MATIVMNMNGCDVEHEVVVNEEYDEEVMCAGWNPQLTLVSESPAIQVNRHVNLPAELTYVDIDTFLKRMYEYQC
jgi:hypothetical protein